MPKAPCTRRYRTWPRSPDPKLLHPAPAPAAFRQALQEGHRFFMAVIGTPGPLPNVNATYDIPCCYACSGGFRSQRSELRLLPGVLRAPRNAACVRQELVRRRSCMRYERRRIFHGGGLEGGSLGAARGYRYQVISGRTPRDAPLPSPGDRYRRM